jgi:SNF2 family DNA or RNA helicase
VEAAGLVRRSDEDSVVDDSSVAASDEAAIAFWQEGLLALRAAVDPPIDVQLSERLARVRVGAPLTGRVHVVLEGNWLDTRLEFSSRELPVELDVIRTALGRNKRWVALSDGTLSRISTSIRALAEEAAEVMDGAEARLPAHQLGRLDRWIDENDGRVDASVDALRSRLRALAVAAEPDMPRDLDGTLRPYQCLGLSWLQFLQAIGAGGILADDMGLGKTITTLAFLLRRKEVEGPAPSLVVCPTSVATNWVREAARFTPTLRVLLLHGPTRERAAASIAECDVVITTYALLRRDLDALAAVHFRCAVLDEAQNIKNARSQARRALERVPAAHRLCLTGTPVENHLGELWSLFDWLSPGLLGDQLSFRRFWRQPVEQRHDAERLEALRQLIAPCVLRRLKRDVARELPPKTELSVPVELGAQQRELYEAIRVAAHADVRRAIRAKGVAASSVAILDALTKLRQVCCDPRLVAMSAARGVVDSAKLEALLELLRDQLAAGHRVLLFSQFTSMLALVAESLRAREIGHLVLTGETRHRQRVVDAFEEGQADVFLISLKAGGTGLNLTSANTVVHYDPWWNPAAQAQATDRAYRIGQTRPVFVHNLYVAGSVEERVLALQEKKRWLSSNLLGDGPSGPALGEAEIEALFAPIEG